MKLFGLALAAAAITVPQVSTAQEKVGNWTLNRIGSECKAVIIQGSDAARREMAVSVADGVLILTLYAPGWTFTATDQPPLALWFVGPGELWPNLTAVVEMSARNEPVLYIGFAPERGPELEALLAQSERMQVVYDGRSLGMFETPGAAAMVAALGRCVRG